MSGCKESSRPPAPGLPGAPAVWGLSLPKVWVLPSLLRGDCALQITQDGGTSFPAPFLGPACYVETQTLGKLMDPLREIRLPHDGDLGRARDRR